MDLFSEGKYKPYNTMKETIKFMYLDITLKSKVHLVKAIVFPVVVYGLSHKESRLLQNWCGVAEDSWELLGLQGDQTSQSERKSVLNIHWENWCWSWNSQYFSHLMRNSDSFEKTLMLGKKAEGEGDDRGWDGWMASPTRWTWVWVCPGCW